MLCDDIDGFVECLIFLVFQRKKYILLKEKGNIVK